MSRGNPAWKPGVSGNPAGKPKGPNKNRILTEALLAKLDEPCSVEPYKSRGETWKTLVVDAFFDHFVSGNPQTQKILFERIEGKVPMALQVDGALTLEAGPRQDTYWMDKATTAEMEEVTRLLGLINEIKRSVLDRPAALDVEAEAIPSDLGRTTGAPTEEPLALDWGPGLKVNEAGPDPQGDLAKDEAADSGDVQEGT